MSKKGALFELIHSLNRSEKRYFKMHCSSSPVDANYVRLFDIIDKQAVYDEAAVKRHFAGEAFIRQLHVAKNYLAKQILKSLRGYHHAISKQAELHDLLRDIEILYTKELYDQCRYAIAKAERIANEYERHWALLEIQHWKRKLLLIHQPPDRERLIDLADVEKQALDKLEALREYWRLMINIFHEIRNDPEALQRHELIAAPASDSDSLQAQSLLANIRFTMNVAIRKYDDALASIWQYADLVRQSPHRVRDDPSLLVTSLNNATSMLVWLKRYDEVPPVLQAIRHIPEQYGLQGDSKFTVRLWLRTYNIELELYRDIKAFDRATTLIREIEQYLDKRRKAAPRGYMVSFWYQFAYIFFMRKEYNAAVVRINAILNARFDDVREDLQIYARLLNLMIHFELQSMMALRYFIDNFRRYLKKKRSIQPYERILLRFFSRISHVPSDEYRALFTKLHCDLFEAETILVSPEVLDYIDLRTWIDDKIRSA